VPRGLALAVVIVLGSCTSDGAGGATAEVSDFEGTWSGHSRGVSIDREGHVDAHYRTYEPCRTAPPEAPCNGEEVIGEMTGALDPTGPRSATISNVEDTWNLALEGDVVELLDDDKIRIGYTIFCGDNTENRLECGA
jgi:hypothetical protein